MTFPAQSSELSHIEKEIVRSVDANQSVALALLERSVNINSGSMNFSGVKAVADVFEEELKGLGFDTSWVDGAKWNRAGHLTARYGSKGKHFLLIGHLDTVFASDSPFQRFEKTGDPNIVKGPGVSDMKGGNVVIVEVVRALRQVGALDDMTVTIVLIGDEESSGKPFSLSREHLVEAATAADVALAFESGDDNPRTVVIARRGFSSWRLDVKGMPAHSSQIFKNTIGYGSIYEMARIVNDFREQLAGEKYLTFNPGVILGGTTLDYDSVNTRGTAFGKPNVIAEHGTVTGDLRTISVEQLEQAKKRMQQIVENNLPGASAEITFDDGYPPLAPTEGNRNLLQYYDQVSSDLGFGPVTAVDPGSAGAADVSFTAGLVDMAIDGLGLLGDGSHTADEVADLRTLPMQIKRAAVLMCRMASNTD